MSKFFKQHRPRSVQPRANGSDRASKHCSHLFVAHFFEFAEDNNFAIIFRQRGNRLTDASDRFERGKFIKACRDRSISSSMAVTAAWDSVSVCAVSTCAWNRSKRTEKVSVLDQGHQAAVLLRALPQVIAGDAKRIKEVTDIWTFAREVASRDPNWKLIATQAAN